MVLLYWCWHLFFVVVAFDAVGFLLFVLRILSTVRTAADCAHTYCDGKKVGKVREDYLNTRLKTLNTEIGDIKYRIILKRGC